MRLTRSVALLALWGGACGQGSLGQSSALDAGFDAPPYRGKLNTKVDLLFMIDDSSQMTAMREKLLAQLPIFMQALQSLPAGLPDLHVGIISSDLGAPSDAPLTGCTASGDSGRFFAMPTGSCASNGFTDPTDG